NESLAVIRHFSGGGADPPDGGRANNWGPATEGVVSTGPAFLLDVKSSLEQQLEWLLRVNPGYLLCYPSVMLGLSTLLRAGGSRVPNLKQLRSFGEILEPDCRAQCEEAFGVKVIDMYSSQEVGYIALECPQEEQYHVQSENLFVEVLDEAGRACQPGEVGKVVVTTLHNFAMPLLRYDIGDYAEVGAPCRCGRNLPV